MGELGFRGVTLGDHVDGRMLDEKAFRPFWREVEAAGVAVFLHPWTTSCGSLRLG